MSGVKFEDMKKNKFYMSVQSGEVDTGEDLLESYRCYFDKENTSWDEWGGKYLNTVKENEEGRFVSDDDAYTK